MENVSFNFTGKRALVTGAGRGIGRAIAIALSKAGAETFALSKTKENLDSLVKEIQDRHTLQSMDTVGIGSLSTKTAMPWKYGWIVPLKDKSGISTAGGFTKIFSSSGRKPGKVWVDKGKKFYNKDVKKLVELYSTENEEKSCVVERWNRTMRDKMSKYFSPNSTRRYVDVLDALTDQYNHTVHSSIRMTPVEASVKKNRAAVWRNLYPDFSTTEDNIPKFSVGDKVRITKRKKTFKKGYNHLGGLKKAIIIEVD